MRHLALIATLAVVGCTSGNTALNPGAPDMSVALVGCAKDTDCKGDRICVGGACTDPPAPPDATSAVDFAPASDMTALLDFTALPDLSVIPDLTVFPDLLMPDLRQPQTPPMNGLVGYWSLDDAPPTAHDTSGNGNNGTVRGASQVPSRIGLAYSFGGNQSCIYMPATASLDMEGGTATSSMAWVFYPGGCDVNVGFAAILGKAGEYQMHVHCADGLFQEETATLPGKGWAPTGGAALSVNQWHHVAVTWDGVTVRQYLDGIQVQWRALDGKLSGPGVIGEYGFGIGCSNVPAAPTAQSTTAYGFLGTVDEVAIYNRALSANEIAAYYTATK